MNSTQIRTALLGLPAMAAGMSFRGLAGRPSYVATAPAAAPSAHTAVQGSPPRGAPV